MPNRRSLLAVAAIVGLAACADQVTAPTLTVRPSLSLQGAAANRYLVVFHGNAIKKGFADRVAALGGQVDAAYDAVGVAVVSGLSAEAAATLGKESGIDDVAADATFTLDDERMPHAIQQADVLATDVGPASQTEPNLAFFFPRQWNYGAISAPQAWAAGFTGSPTVRVAILDSGIDFTYPDLVGLVDLAHSASFVPSDNALINQFFPGRNPVTDLNGHGTHVASTVSSRAAVVAGVTSRTTLMAVKVLGANGSGSFVGIFQGIMYATDNGADVINMSLGANFFRAQSEGFVGALNRAVNYAHNRGVTTVVAAANDAIDLDHDGNLYAIFCDNPKVICVAATGPDSATTVNGPFFPSLDLPAVYSNFGRSAINVAAPGGNFRIPADPNAPITSAVFVWQACSKTMLDFDENTETFSLSVCAANPQLTFTLGEVGTSMASPHVAGLAALLVQQYGRSPAQIRARIQQTADDLGQSGTDPHFGKGRINVARAVGVM